MMTYTFMLSHFNDIDRFSWAKVLAVISHYTFKDTGVTITKQIKNTVKKALVDGLYDL